MAVKDARGMIFLDLPNHYFLVSVSSPYISRDHGKIRPDAPNQILNGREKNIYIFKLSLIAWKGKFDKVVLEISLI